MKNHPLYGAPHAYLMACWELKENYPFLSREWHLEKIMVDIKRGWEQLVEDDG